MAQKRERVAPRQRATLTENTQGLDNLEIEDTAPETSRQADFAALWLTRRVPVSLVVARHLAEIHGLGGRAW